MSRLLSALLAVSFSVLAVTSSHAGPGMRDVRIPLIVSEQERSHVLAEMREFLHGLHSIQLALARNDMKAIELVAKSMGAFTNKMPQAMRDRMPEEFTQLAIGQHEVFQVIARDAVEKKDINLTLGQVAESLTYCSGCHDTYRFELGRPKQAGR